MLSELQEIGISFDINLLENYKAKSDGTTLLKHICDAIEIAKQIKYIFNLDKSTYISLCRCIIYHDLGKITKSFQNNIESTIRLIRHEILSASVKDLLDKERLSILTHHKELESLRNVLINSYYSSELKEMSEELKVEVEDIRQFIREVNKSDNELIKDLDCILLKGYLQYCDHVASANINEIEFGFSAIDTYKFNNYNSIQSKVLKLKEKEDILIIGPTGIGKTATSLFWSDIMQDTKKSRRIYYLLPFISSINALYKDMHSKDMSVSMLHNKAEYFLNEMEKEDTKDKYNLFKKGIKQINIATIYQVVKCVFACQRYEMLLAQFKNSIFIIDEIHCFDIKQTALLLTTLKFFKEKLNISICIMSASIPTNLQKLICTELGIKKIVKASKEDYKIRHKVHRVKKDILDSIDTIKKDLEDNKRVILCINTVNTAQELYTQLKEYNPVLIHGRMNTRDREKAEQNLKNCNLLIGTQAIEVSLDIDFDKMYTEIAPLDSLLQRLGRVNRYGVKGISDIFIYNYTSNIYKQELITRTDIVIDDIIQNENGLILEEDIQKNLDKVYADIDLDTYYKECKDINELINILKIGTFNKNTLDCMISNNTISVLPISLLDEYKKLIDDKKYLEAKSLLVNVRYSNYIKEHIKTISINYDKINNAFITDLLYDDRGLVYEMDSSSNFL